jgi:hypothetical protein
MTRVRLFALLLAMTAAGVSVSFAGLASELDAGQLKALNAGKHVAVHLEVEGKPWPRVKIYARVDASPEEVAAVFFDYPTAKTYIPDVVESRISKRVSPRKLEVDYEVDVPILPDEQYTALNEIETLEGGGYLVSWRLLRALQTKGAEGNLRVEPSGGGSIICYTNLVTPGSAMAKLLRSLALKRMDSTVEAIVEKVEEQKRRHPAELARQVDALRAALTGNP